MKISFLGTGTSQGVPMIGCDCPVCVSKDPRDRRHRTHVHIEMGGLNIQIDAAQEFRIRAIELGIPKVDLVLLTHGHADHILGMDDLRRFCDQREGEAIPVYSNEEGLERMKAIFPYAICDRPSIRGYPAFRPEMMPKVLDLGKAGRVYATSQSHGNFETLGLLFEEKDSGSRIAYYTDCNAVSEEAVGLAQGADIAVLDALRPFKHPSHMSIDQAIEAACQIGAKQSYLIHMTHHIRHEEVDTQLPDGINLSYDGLALEV